MPAIHVGESFQETRLYQLERLARLNMEHRDDLNENGQWLLDRSMFTMYCDLHDFGEGVEALRILSGVPEELTRNPG